MDAQCADMNSVLADVESILRSLRGVWDEEAVDELDHALQCGHQASRDGADDELILAAALHDLGHSPNVDRHRHHDVAARDWLTPRFGARVGWLAGAHVAAKRFLAATEPGYAADLSETSVMSMNQQGGPGVDVDWTTHEWWADAVRLRRFDDAAKMPGAPALSVDDVLVVARRVLEHETGAR
ncbi:HD family phosphohydrolase [Gordonia sp. CPCC 205515]|uniref:HD family phosphohydrolase n=1 Tax=Gordonia sp. CPCC 205515 TaxID=3140791 RepID=UPI003AF40A8B